MYKNLIEHETKKGFYKHPDINGVFISKAGEVYDSWSETFLEQTNNGGYKSISKLRGIKVHNLVCQTFLLKPPELASLRLIPNHKNGIKTDNRVENLEWVTFSGNAKHAYETGLRKDNTPILIKDLRTGEIVRYYSLQEAARSHQVNGANIFWYLKPGKIGNVFKKYFIIIREGMSWPDKDHRHIDPKGTGIPRDILVYEKKINTFFLFSNELDARNHTGFKRGYLSEKLRKEISKGLNSLETENYCIWYLDMYPKELPLETINCKTFRRSIYRKRPPRKPIPISVLDTETGKEETHLSSEIFARSIGVSKNTFQKHIFQNKGMWKKRFRVRYLR